MKCEHSQLGITDFFFPFCWHHPNAAPGALCIYFINMQKEKIRERSQTVCGEFSVWAEHKHNHTPTDIVSVCVASSLTANVDTGDPLAVWRVTLKLTQGWNSLSRLSEHTCRDTFPLLNTSVNKTVLPESLSVLPRLVPRPPPWVSEWPAAPRTAPKIVL